MLKKLKNISVAVYISLIIPLITMYLIPLIYTPILGENREYYKLDLINTCKWIYIIISIVLVISTYFITNKKISEIFYFTIGIIIMIISQMFKSKNILLILHMTTTARYILIAGYLILILYLLLQNKKENSKDINKSNFENLD